MKHELFSAIDAAPPHAGALEELLFHLREDALPDSWLAEHAPDGRLDPAWHACANPRVLLRFLGREAEPERLATALLALVRQVIAGEQAELAALQAFAEGRATRAELEQAFEALQLQDPGGPLLVLSDALNFLLDERDRSREPLLASMLRNLRLALEPHVEPGEDVPSEVVLQLADAIRAAVPCPPLHDLIQKYCPPE